MTVLRYLTDPHCVRAGTRRACAIRAGRFPAHTPQGEGGTSERSSARRSLTTTRCTTTMTKAKPIATTAGVLGRRLAILAQCASVRRTPAPAVTITERRPALTTGGASYAAAHAGREHLVERIRPAEPVTVDVLQPLPGNTSARLSAAAHVSNLKVSLQLRHMELIGLAEDGRMFLWSTGNVQPCDRFETHAHGGIVTGHYVIDVAGHAIVVHCGALTDGRVSVQFMCSRLRPVYVPRANVEAILLGRVVPNPEAEAKITAGLRELIAIAQARQQAPHRARGAIS